ncbi:MAG: hypothetical protein ABIS86_16055 [Streptosporangiaceae bacterium]
MALRSDSESLAVLRGVLSPSAVPAERAVRSFNSSLPPEIN